MEGINLISVFTLPASLDPIFIRALEIVVQIWAKRERNPLLRSRVGREGESLSSQGRDSDLLKLHRGTQLAAAHHNNTSGCPAAESWRGIKENLWNTRRTLRTGKSSWATPQWSWGTITKLNTFVITTQLWLDVPEVCHLTQEPHSTGMETCSKSTFLLSDGFPKSNSAAGFVTLRVSSRRLLLKQ